MAASWKPWLLLCCLAFIAGGCAETVQNPPVASADQDEKESTSSTPLSETSPTNPPEASEYEPTPPPRYTEPISTPSDESDEPTPAPAQVENTADTPAQPPAPPADAEEGSVGGGFRPSGSAPLGAPTAPPILGGGFQPEGGAPAAPPAAGGGFRPSESDAPLGSPTSPPNLGGGFRPDNGVAPSESPTAPPNLGGGFSPRQPSSDLDRPGAPSKPLFPSFGEPSTTPGSAAPPASAPDSAAPLSPGVVEQPQLPPPAASESNGFGVRPGSGLDREEGGYSSPGPPLETAPGADLPLPNYGGATRDPGTPSESPGAELPRPSYDAPRGTPPGAPLETPGADFPAPNFGNPGDRGTPPAEMLPQPHTVRPWRDRTGLYSEQGKFVEKSDGYVRLVRSDGKRIRIPFEKLSEYDQGFADALSNPEATTQMRTWSDASETYTMTGKYLSLADGSLRLEDASGQRFRIEVSQLSDYDRGYVEAMRE